MGHILWWLRLISIHMEHSASESRRVQRRMSAAGPPTLHSLIRPTAPAQSDSLHTAAKSMGGRGPVYQFASMSSIREVCTPSPSPDRLAAKYAESTRVWHSRFGEILFGKRKKKKKMEAFESRAIDFWINKKSSCMEMSPWKWLSHSVQVFVQGLGRVSLS